MRRQSDRGRFAALVSLALLACTSAPPATTRSVEIPFELTQNHIYLPVVVEDLPPAWFLLDTGAAATVLAQTTADATQIKPSGKATALGMGPDTVQITVFRNVDLKFGGLDLTLDRAAAMSLRDLSLIEGRMMDGILGFNVLRRFTIEVDYQKHLLRFHDPATYAAPPSAVALPITFSHNHPVIDARLTLADGRSLPMKLMVDTGARGAFALNRPFAEKFGIYDAVSPAVEGAFGAGVGGASSMRVGRVRQIAIDRFTFDAPVVSISRDSAGAGARKDVDGLVGGEILKRFTLTIDYPHNRLLMTPSHELKQPFEYEMAGILLRSVDETFKRFVVRQIISNSPASEAGIEVGDEIVSINGVAVSAMTSESIREMFRQPGKTYTLRLVRASRAFEKTIRTRRLL